MATKRKKRKTTAKRRTSCATNYKRKRTGKRTAKTTARKHTKRRSFWDILWNG